MLYTISTANLISRNTSDLRSPLVTNFSRTTVFSWLRITFLVLLDTIMLAVAWLVANQLGTPVEGLHFFGETGQYPGLLFPILVISLGTLTASGLYGTDDRQLGLRSLIKALTLAQLILLVTAYLYQPIVSVSYSVFFWAWLLTLSFVGLERLLLHYTVINLRKKHVALRQSVFLLGEAKDVEKAKQLLKRSQQFHLQGVAVLSGQNTPKQWDETLEKIRNYNVSEVWICTWQSVKNLAILYWQLKSAGIHLRIIPTSLELPRKWTEIKMIDEFATIRFGSSPIINNDFGVKRCFDLVASSVILLLISLPMILIAVAIKLDSPGPIFYKQTRVGLQGRLFKVWKFRTMVANASQLQKELEAKNEVKGGVLFKIKDDPRITRVGKFLRRYSLDELPQLINVLRGEMSLVGPRPLPLRDVERIPEDYFLRHEVLPGITGLWQVNGRSDVDSEAVFFWDTTYIQQWSLSLDLKILLQTIQVVLTKEGAY